MKMMQKIVSLSVMFFMTSSLASECKTASEDSHVFEARRKKLMAKVEKGIVIIQSTERNQDNLLEFYVPDSDNHDFIYFTGLQTPGATLVLCPSSETYSEILYIDGNADEIRRQTGIQHVYPANNLMPDLSNAYTDFSQLRFTQRRFKPLPSEISRVLYDSGGKKLIYFNFPRFVNLSEAPPERLEFIHTLSYYSPKYEMRDACDLIDSIRMYHDEYALEQLRKAAHITGIAMMECMKSAQSGMTEWELRSVFNFVCQYQGAEYFGFPTSTRSGPRRSYDETPRHSKIMELGELISIDAGAEWNHYSADMKRTFPVGGKFTEEQKKIYNILKKAHLACIRMVKPGITMKDLQDKAMQILNAEGGYGKYFTWGTSHFLGMEVHDHGNNLIPFKPGVAITVEPGIGLPEFSVELEDDVVCTEDGYEWLTEFVPIDVEEIEMLWKEVGIGEVFFNKQKNK